MAILDLLGQCSDVTHLYSVKNTDGTATLMVLPHFFTRFRLEFPEDLILSHVQIYEYARKATQPIIQENM
jgi:hypothetical protein